MFDSDIESVHNNFVNDKITLKGCMAWHRIKECVEEKLKSTNKESFQGKNESPNILEKEKK